MRIVIRTACLEINSPSRITTTCAISAYHHQSWEFESRSWRGVLDLKLCDKVCQ